MTCPTDDANLALRIARSVGAIQVIHFEELMISCLEALEAAFSDITLRHLRSLPVYLLAIALWIDGSDAGLPNVQQQIITRHRDLVHEELFQSVLRRLRDGE